MALKTKPAALPVSSAPNLRILRDPALWSAVSALLSVVAAFMLLWYQRENTDIQRQTFRSANRPYVSASALTPMRDTVRKTIVFQIELKNVGTVPATDFQPVWKIYENGVEQPQYGVVERKPTLLFPQQGVMLFGVIPSSRFDALASGATQLEIVVDVAYRGTDIIHHSHQKFRYMHDINILPEVEGGAD
jgi:hypothetical protein